ncbi:unnamed protein product, partial [Didymodactylos carnosus]
FFIFTRSIIIHEEKMKLFLTETPNRQDFWELMIKNEIFTNCKELFLFTNKEIENKNYNELLSIKPKDKSIIFFEKIDWKNVENIKYVYKTCAINNVDKNLKIYEEQKLILSNKMATINIEKLQNLSTIGKFDSIKSNDFMKIENLNENESNEIFQLLFEQNIITIDGLLLTNNLEKLNLKKYEIYKQRIISILNCQCLYKIQILELLEKMNLEKFDNDNIHLTLENNLHKQLMYDLESSLILRPICFNHKIVEVSFCDKMIARNYEDKLEKFLIENSNIGENKDIYKSLTKSLQTTIGKLNFLLKPNSYLNDIKEKFNENEKFEHLEELELFKINSLDQIIGI